MFHLQIWFDQRVNPNQHAAQRCWIILQLDYDWVKALQVDEQALDLPGVGVE